MAIDLKRGDILTDDSIDYAILLVDPWQMLRRKSRGIKRLMTTCYSTKRNPPGGKRGLPVAHLSNVIGTPIQPGVSRDILQRIDTQTPYRARQVFFYDGGKTYYHCIVEEVAR